MVETIINTSISIIVSGLIGFLLGQLKTFKAFKMALMLLIQNTLTNTYFVYSQKKVIPDYVCKGWNNLFKIYKQLGGNDYCDTLKNKMSEWEIVQTGILEKLYGY